VSYDTIIIGAGMSGLAAGIRLAYYEKSVCLLERHTTIGGLNSFYRLRGRNHDVGLHAVTNYAAPGTRTGPLSKLLRQLRLSWDDFDLAEQNQSAIAFPGHVLRFTNEFEFFEQQVADQFPSQVDGFRKLVRQINDFDDRRLDHPSMSTRQVLAESLTDPALIDMLLCPLQFYGSSTPDDIDFLQFVILFKSIFQEGFARPREGVRPILKALVRQFKRLGGELQLRTGVQRILTEQGRAVGVVLDDGRELIGRNVLSSAGVAETMSLCNAPAELQARHPAGRFSFVEAIFCLDQQPVSWGHQETIIFYNDSPQFCYGHADRPVDVRSGVVCCPNNFQYARPLDEGWVRITAQADPQYWIDRTDADYVTQKAHWRDRMVASALRWVPDFRSHIVDADVFTPRTIRKFTGHVNGCVYGAPAKIHDGRTHLEGLYLCGTDQGYLGIVGSMLSGISIANMHLLRD